MIKLLSVEPKNGYELLLRFSDGAFGVYDFASMIETQTEMTAPLRDPEFFGRHFIELGALAWPNGFDLSAGSLYEKLRDTGKLQRDSKAA
ncbi:MAG TPA: DUF2442 domain-containing protein [Rhodanobacteraceae bacterium]|nr:DUF2442 domain-containing protein [Rhodanobacteraceae bacterium]